MVLALKTKHFTKDPLIVDIYTLVENIDEGLLKITDLEDVQITGINNLKQYVEVTVPQSQFVEIKEKEIDFEVWLEKSDFTVRGFPEE